MAILLVENKINNSFILFRGNEEIKESVVEKFIPFNSEQMSNVAHNNQKYSIYKC